MEQEQPTDSVKGVVQRRVNYREVFNHASWFAIGVLTPDGRVLEISNIVLDESGLPLEEIVGKPFVELPAWSHSTEAQEQIRQAIGRAGRGETVRIDIRVYPTEEFYRDLDVTIMPFVDGDSKAEYLIFTGTDITERKRLEEERRSFIDSIPDLAWMVSPDGSLEYLNKRWYTYTQTSPNQVQGEVFSQYIHPDERQQAVEQWYAAMRAGVPAEIEFRLRHGATGEYRWFLARWVPVKNAQGHIVYWFGTGTDIHDKKQAEAALRISEARYRTLFDSNMIGLALTDFDGRVWEANDAYLHMLGYTQEDLARGMARWDVVTPPEYRERGQEANRQMLETGNCQPYEKEYQRKDGQRVPVVIGRALLGEEGGKTITFCLDITERKELDQRKDEFISIASHELRTPLTSLKLLIQFLHRRLKKERNQRIEDNDLNHMEVQVDTLRHLVDDLLNVSKIQLGKFSYEDEPLNLDETIRGIVELLQSSFPSHTMRLFGSTHQFIRCDRQRLEQVLTNLITNAVKYSPQADKVDIFLTLSNACACIQVRDYGIGIPEAYRDRIFERFNRGAYSTSEQAFPGLGMGLYITYEIVTHYGGDITVESEEGKGTTFSVTLPLQKRERTAMGPF
jgi:PAS domain S-box-containing protein